MFAQHDALLVMTQDETVRARVIQCFAPSLKDKVWHVENNEFWDIEHVREITLRGNQQGIRWLAFMNVAVPTSPWATQFVVLYDHTSVASFRFGKSLLPPIGPGDLIHIGPRKVYTWVDGEGYM